MYETLSEPFADQLSRPVYLPEDADAPAAAAPATDTFLDLLTDIEHRPDAGNRLDVIARYQSWIGRNSAASAALYAAWFNLGVELGGAGDKAGAIDAYQNSLALKPGFYPAAINLGTALEFTGQPDAALATWQQALQPDETRIALLAHRDRLVEARRLAQEHTAKVLNVGSGVSGREHLPPYFRRAGWREVRLDSDSAVLPDIVATMTDMHAVSAGFVDAVYSSDAITYLYPHEVPLALREMRRVLDPSGVAFIALSDLQEVARLIAEGKLSDPLYISPAGPIAPLDILYGHRASLTSGLTSVAPRTGFTSATLGAVLIEAGFAAVLVQRGTATCRLTAIAFPTRPDHGRLASVQEQMLPAAGQPAVLYVPTG